jgi:hypothetical protein
MKYLFFLLVLIGCSSMDREKCMTTNWYEKGVEDGASKGKDFFVEYKRECANKGVTINVAETNYHKGVGEGLKSWCSYTNGLSQGLEGRKTTPRCDSISTAYTRGYEEGYREFVISMRKKREEDERKKIYNSEMESFRSKVLRSDTKECSVDSDCHKEGQCEFGHCAHNNQNCTYNYECKMRGWCREVSEWTPEKTRLSLRVCDY